MPHEQTSNFKNDGFKNFTPDRPPHGVEWMRAHPYAFAVYGIVVALVVGALVVVRQDTTPEGEITTWSGTNTGALDTAYYEPPQTTIYASTSTQQPSMIEDLSRNDQSFVIPAPIPGPKEPEDSLFDIGEFLLRFNPGATPRAPSSNTQSAAELIKEAYSYIPSSLISVKTTQDSRTEAQQSLFKYGNAIGDHIQTFEDQYPNAVAILKDQYEDRGNPVKVSALERYAKSMADVGNNFLTADAVPTEVTSVHNALAKSYITIGINLALVAKTISDADFLYAIEVYNKSVEAYTKNFITMATLFSVFEIRFGSVDSGRVFSFTPAGVW